jgi:3-deoxy-D-arabino-heptulosonate 7-phosphate (DAHP) synthase
VDRRIHTDDHPPEAPPLEPPVVPEPEHHDGDEDEWVAIPDALVSLDAHGVRITAHASGETAVHDVKELILAAVDAIEKLRHQVQ